MNVILIGFMATGKSTIGRHLGRRMDMPYLDMDRLLQGVFDMSVPEIFERHGEAEFRRAETELLTKLLEERDLPINAARQYPRRYVLSTGGGTPLCEENRPLLKALGHVVWLKASAETLAHRCRPHIDRRPLLHGHADDLEDHILSLLERREPVYEDLAGTTIWTDDATNPEQIAREIRAVLPGTRARRSPADSGD